MVTNAVLVDELMGRVTGVPINILSFEQFDFKGVVLEVTFMRNF